MDSFFKRSPVPKNSSNCELAQSMHYIICGCEGQGYAGADTGTKKVVLAWLPRTAAILSILVSLYVFKQIVISVCSINLNCINAVSLFIIVDTQRIAKKHSKPINKYYFADFLISFASTTFQILCATSIFDVMGSFAMSFTTLPIPQEDYIYGSSGSDGTCKSQAWEPLHVFWVFLWLCITILPSNTAGV
ncbi:hypothetical protein ACHAWO_007758 [Cyclotella atomus]|uniref:Uncharacterized protein n=1 Tax=Cyclotella atomus TaxID=382360 RepID=A0ABD3PKD8_9STRA